MSDLDTQTEAQIGAHTDVTTDAQTTRPHGGVPATARLAPAADLPPAGGDGNVTYEQDGGGPVLTAARISLVYWGSAWTSATANPTAAQVTAALTDLVTGPWGTQLNQYHGIGPSAIDQVVTSGSLSDSASSWLKILGMESPLVSVPSLVTQA